MVRSLTLLLPMLCLVLVLSVIAVSGFSSSVAYGPANQSGDSMTCTMCDRLISTPGDFTSLRQGEQFEFCCPGCKWSFDNHEQLRQLESGGAYTDPVCRMEVGSGIELIQSGESYYFCTTLCRDLFSGDPNKYLTDSCLVCRTEGIQTQVTTDSPSATWQDTAYRFCTTSHRDQFRADPGGFFMHTMWGIPGWLYYASIALVLILSFGVIESRAGKESGSPLKIDLLRHGWILGIVKHNATRFICRLLLVLLFGLIIGAGLFGNQLPSKNIAPLLTWTIWWGGLIWLVAYLGKAFCYACPWDAVADWAEGFRFWGVKNPGLGLQLQWPKSMRNIWPATILFIGLTWVELGFGVTMIPRATAWLALAMLGLAFVSAFIFDRRSFCRYGCLVGRISGLYALFAPVEIRARDRSICRICTTKSCYKGNDLGEPCPTFEFMGTMNQNTYCISCMECVKSCEKDNVTVNIRAWAIDLANHHKPRADEAYLALLMLSLTGFHGLTMTAAWGRVTSWISAELQVSDHWAFAIGMAGIMVAPALLYAGLVWLSRLLAAAKSSGYREYFIRYAYALIPIALFYHLAHNSEHLLMEGQKIVMLLSDPFGWEWNLFGTSHLTLQPLIRLEYLWILQVIFVMIGHVYSLWTARRAAGAIFGNPRAALRSQVVMLGAMILFSLMSLWLLKQPMMMRSSSM